MMHSSKGFTLVELLLGLLIASIIGVCAYNLFWASLKLNDRMRYLYDRDRQVLMADYTLTLDLENAISLEGKGEEFSFLTQTPRGIKHVRYYSGNADLSPLTKIEIGRVTNPSRPKALNKNFDVFLLRQESSLSDWENETHHNTSAHIVAAGLEKGTFHCQYAPYGKNLQAPGAVGIDYQDSWDEKSLPMSVRCRFIMDDPQRINAGLVFQRDIFLAPISSQ